jgi:hypothetical protein
MSSAEPQPAGATCDLAGSSELQPLLFVFR